MFSSKHREIHGCNFTLGPSAADALRTVTVLLASSSDAAKDEDLLFVQKGLPSSADASQRRLPTVTDPTIVLGRTGRPAYRMVAATAMIAPTTEDVPAGRVLLDEWCVRVPDGVEMWRESDLSGEGRWRGVDTAIVGPMPGRNGVSFGTNTHRIAHAGCEAAASVLARQ